MYVIDELDQVVERTDIPHPEAGAPIPTLVNNEQRLFVAYYISAHERENWSGQIQSRIRLGDQPEFSDSVIAIIEFDEFESMMFGWPNDEVMYAHPLKDRGLQWYSVQEVRHSSWLRRLEELNSCHVGHNPARFMEQRHILFAFHDSTLEVIARSEPTIRFFGGAMKDATRWMATELVSR